MRTHTEFVVVVDIDGKWKDVVSFDTVPQALDDMHARRRRMQGVIRELQVVTRVVIDHPIAATGDTRDIDEDVSGLARPRDIAPIREGFTAENVAWLVAQASEGRRCVMVVPDAEAQTLWYRRFLGAVHDHRDQRRSHTVRLSEDGSIEVLRASGADNIVGVTWEIALFGAGSSPLRDDITARIRALVVH